MSKHSPQPQTPGGRDAISTPRDSRSVEGGDRPRTAASWVPWLFVSAFLAALLSPVDYTGSDAQGTLLTAQSLVQTGTLRLDRYMERTYVPPSRALGEVSGKYRLIRGHCYYSFPLGSALASAPLVWLANLTGEDMVDAAADSRLQNVISALLVGIMAWLALRMCRCFAGERDSLVLAAAFTLGSPLASTVGTALWSCGYATVFVFLSLLLLTRHWTEGASLKPWRLGLLMGLAVLCRPTAGIFAACVVGVTASQDRRSALRMAGGTVLVLVALVSYSLLEFGRVLPDYYLPQKRLPGPALILMGGVGGVILAVVACSYARKRSASWSRRLRAAEWALGGLALAGAIMVAVLVAGHETLAPRVLPPPLSRAASAVYGSLMSPSRGLVVFCPYLVVALVVLAGRARAIRADRILWIAMAWLGLHLAAVARPFRWYGGHCYGPRLFTEAFPAVMVLTLIAWRELASAGRLRRILARTTLWLSLATGIFMHTHQGLFNQWTVRWNSSPNIDLYEADLFAWRYAQFLASPRLVERRQIDHGVERLSRYQPGREFSVSDTAAVYFQNWEIESADSTGLTRRTTAFRSAIWLIPGLEIRNYSTATLSLVAAADSRKRVYVTVNGEDAGLLRITTRAASTVTVTFPTALLRPNVPNEIAFEVYPTDSPASNLLPGIRLWRLRIDMDTG